MPIALATLHFQWIYFFLQYKTGFGLDWWFFATPLLVDICFAAWWITEVVRTGIFARD